MGKDRCSGECKLEHFESTPAEGVKTPWGILLQEVGHWDDDIGVPRNKMMMEIRKSEEGLNIADISGLWPIEDDLHLLLIHADSQCGAVETMLSQPMDNLPNMLQMVCCYEREDKDII